MSPYLALKPSDTNSTVTFAKLKPLHHSVLPHCLQRCFPNAPRGSSREICQDVRGQDELKDPELPQQHRAAPLRRFGFIKDFARRKKNPASQEKKLKKVSSWDSFYNGWMWGLDIYTSQLFLMSPAHTQVKETHFIRFSSETRLFCSQNKHSFFWNVQHWPDFFTEVCVV